MDNSKSVFPMFYRVGHSIEILYFKDISGSFSLCLGVVHDCTSLFPLLFCTHPSHPSVGREVVIIYLSSQALSPSEGGHGFS